MDTPRVTYTKLADILSLRFSSKENNQLERGKGNFGLTVTYYHRGVVKSPGTLQLLSLSP